MSEFFITLVTCSITMSVIALLLIAITPALSQRYAAKWFYYAWLLIIIGLIIPYRPQFDTGFIQVKTPIISEKIIHADSVLITGTTGIPDKRSLVPDQGINRFFQIIYYIWLAGVIIISIYHILRHRTFLKTVNRWSSKIQDTTIMDTFQRLKTQMGISSDIDLRSCLCITSPMMIGFRKPVILLPNTEYAADELTLILKHELTHLQRKDLWFKTLLIIATTLHWFNPVIYLIARTITTQCEVSCDEAVLENTDLQKRQVYGETIIRTFRQQPKQTTVLSTNFYGGKRSIKHRIFTIMDRRPKKVGIAVFLLILLATISTGSVFAINNLNQSNILLSTSTVYTISGTTGTDSIVIKDNIQLELQDFSPISATNGADTNNFYVKAYAKNAIVRVTNFEKTDQIIMELLISQNYTNEKVLKSAVENSLVQEYGVEKNNFIIQIIEMK